MAVLEADIIEDWQDVSPLDYIQSFDRQVSACDFFEILLDYTRRAMLTFQKNLKTSESLAKKQWTSELVQLKSLGYTANFDRICTLEKKLNDASEKFISDRLGNYLKNDTLTSEKMTPRFLCIAKDTNCVTDFLGDLINHPVIRGCMLNEEEKARLEGDLTLDELDDAVEGINLGSAPGIDGLNNKFIRKFWNYFRIPLHDYTIECFRKKELTHSFRTALIRLIPKKGDTKKIKNWRPISLLTCFYKVISKAVNARLDSVIDKVTSLDQKAYNKNRYIQEALICTIDTIRHCETNGIKGVILSIDQKKAFDSVYHGYMNEVYKFFNFDVSFINLLETIGNGRTARVLLEDDKPSREFDLDRGFAQGNGPSPKKYNIGEQILLFRLAYDPLIFGVYSSFLVPRTVRKDDLDAGWLSTRTPRTKYN